MRNVRTLALAAGALAAALIAVGGCGPAYYRVTDPTTGRSYFTTELQEKGAGSVQLRDAGTGRTVTLQNSEVQTVTKEQFETGKLRAAVSEPALPGGDPAPPPAPR